MSFCHIHVFDSVFNLDVPARARRENGHDSPSSRSTVQNTPAILSSGVGSDRTRPNRLDLWNLNGSDPIGSDRSFEFRCRTAAGPERKGTANRLPRHPKGRPYVPRETRPIQIKIERAPTTKGNGMSTTR
ncbi:unnamed protein product [Dovyalis caffra]|uniref:Uncharacterized protein n=1 Tax=Dovyalis caffra TaxID=77055 RepID=A0AAV1QVZ3_9ROSI|nr:unnamed protein product [Dovyalis caffra]